MGRLVSRNSPGPFHQLTTHNLQLFFMSRPSTPQNPPNQLKTLHIKVQNTWHSSYAQPRIIKVLGNYGLDCGKSQGAAARITPFYNQLIQNGLQLSAYRRELYLEHAHNKALTLRYCHIMLYLGHPHNKTLPSGRLQGVGGLGEQKKKIGGSSGRSRSRGPMRRLQPVTLPIPSIRPADWRRAP